ncbi:septal ring lytic transglycosylase RlpA family protein [Aquamicrobium segne]|uniref:Endolytic peptidoglycan transglycosylase RlpA n=1 Tax=Aquamicrobium segne TaxID=469547 RepID=A0ABW0GYN4_9HYPH
MYLTARPRLRRTLTIMSFAVSAVALAACATPQPKEQSKARSKEYFPESKYGVKASPRVAQGSKIRRGGGRDQTGKPYKVAGKWYTPKEDTTYVKTGSASWYGDAFHGRLTANGEVYDMEHLTAAHPTMPLPSYARVTNVKNGSSVIVRVNDRGPYHGNRVIDLSKRAADMLGYRMAGTAQVKVEYVGRAPLEGDDEPYLVATYQPGNQAPDPSVGLPTGVMIAMNGATPSRSRHASPMPFPPQPVGAPSGMAFGNGGLPDQVPVAPNRPDFELPPDSPFALASLSYADERISSAAQAFDAVDRSGLTAQAVSASWKANNARVPGADYVVAGSFENSGAARQLAERLSSLGKISISQSDFEGRTWHSVEIYDDGHASLDAILLAAWKNGAPDALVVRN